ncbi:MAG: Dihydroneopterin aldolase [Verrucomicrobia subdivision 3 bacterium]|nr:Dihydroneopterin aldolase [Limisphaerales bacterium]MCS1417100.1 Dihydroneopterin aldolase [Limisphaerales bacterium]
MDQIIIEDLEVYFQIGVPDKERAQPQKLHLSVVVEHSLDAAARSDDLSQTIDYDALTEQLIHFGESKEWKLLERLAHDIVRWILSEHGGDQVTVEVKKFIIPNARHVAVQLTRSK